MGLVRFVTTTGAGYSGITSKDKDTLYFISDERRIYKGEVPYSGGIFTTVAEFPETGEVNTLYVNSATGEVRYYNGTSYQTVVPATGKSITGKGDGSLATTAAVAAYVTSQIATANANASTAVSTAKTAASDAATAKTNASSAVSTANSASGTASKASTDAAAAVKTANAASSNASSAVSTANGAVSTANAASSTANTAKSTADTAKSTADSAKAAAGSAQSQGTADDAWARTLRVQVSSAPADAAGDTSRLTATVWRGGEQLSDEAVAKMGLLAWYVGGSRVATGGTYTCAAGTAAECRLEA